MRIIRLGGEAGSGMKRKERRVTVQYNDRNRTDYKIRAGHI